MKKNRSIKHTSQRTEAKAIVAKFRIVSSTVNLISLTLTRIASNKPRIKVQVPKVGTSLGCLPAEPFPDTALREIRRVRLGVRQATIGIDVHLLATRNKYAKAKRVVAASKHSAVSRRAVLGADLGRAVG
jgi:hypothetical protein